MSKAKFVYVTYIRSTPAKVWKGLIDAEFTRRYWEHLNVSNWKRGSKWEHVSTRKGERGDVDIVGKVVECKPPKRLVITWATPAQAAKPSKNSRVTLEIEPVAKRTGMVRLTVTHDQLEPRSGMLKGITDGWPRVLASLKSMLETGRPLKTWAGH